MAGPAPGSCSVILFSWPLSRARSWHGCLLAAGGTAGGSHCAFTKESVCQNRAERFHHNLHKQGGLRLPFCLTPSSAPPSLPLFPLFFSSFPLPLPLYTGNRTQALSLLGKCPTIEPHPKPHEDSRGNYVSCLELKILQARSHQISPTRHNSQENGGSERAMLAHSQKVGIAAGLETQKPCVSYLKTNICNLTGTPVLGREGGSSCGEKSASPVGPPSFPTCTSARTLQTKSRPLPAKPLRKGACSLCTLPGPFVLAPRPPAYCTCQVSSLLCYPCCALCLEHSFPSFGSSWFHFIHILNLHCNDTTSDFVETGTVTVAQMLRLQAGMQSHCMLICRPSP